MAGKNDIIEHVAEAADLTKKQAGDVVDAVLGFVSDALTGGDKVQIAGFGTFQVSERKERQGRNPQTGEELKIPARTVPVFKPGAGLKAVLSQGK